MNHSASKNARPWWDEVAHLRTDDGVSPKPSAARTADLDASPLAAREPRSEIAADSPRSRAHPSRPRTTPSSRRRSSERPRADWFADEASTAGRRAAPKQDTRRPERPRATLIDVSPDHTFMRRAQQVRRKPGERPTVTITGRPEGALPPQVREQPAIRGRRAREGASSLVSSPDRLILWAVALGLLMILASIGTASAHAETALTLLH